MACSPSKPLPWTPIPLTHTPCFVPCERMWPGSHPWGGVSPNDGLLRHIAQPWASPSPAGPVSTSGPETPGPLLEGPAVWLWNPNQSLSRLHTPILPCCAVSRLVTLTWSGWMELVTRGQCNWLQTCSCVCSVQWAHGLSSVYVSSSEATARHNGTKTLSITIKWVCAQGVEGKGEGVTRRLREESMFRGMPRPNVGRWRQVGGPIGALRDGGGVLN